MVAMAIHPLPVYQTKGAFWAWMVYVVTKLFEISLFILFFSNSRAQICEVFYTHSLILGNFMSMHNCLFKHIGCTDGLGVIKEL